MFHRLLISIVFLAGTGLDGRAQDKVFSGPQVGERLPPFSVRGFFGDDAGKELNFVTQAGGKPIVLVFIHDCNRKSLLMTRTLTMYTAERAKDGLATGVIWLTDDVSEGEILLKRWAHALAKHAPLGIYLDGKEGPGSYGLNRNVTLTILIAKEGRVTANFPLVQPSTQVDLPKILQEIANAAGGPVAKAEHLIVAEILDYQVDQVQGPMRQIIREAANQVDVDKAAAALEDFVRQNDHARKEVGRITRNIVESGSLASFGTARGQEYLSKWAKVYGGATQINTAGSKK